MFIFLGHGSQYDYAPRKVKLETFHMTHSISLSIYLILGFSHAIRVSLLGERPDGPWETHHKKHPKSGGEQQHPKAPNAALSHVSKLNITGQLDL